MLYDKILTKCFCPQPHAHRTNLAMCGARTRTPIIASARAPAHISIFLLLKIMKLKKKCYVRTCAACPHLRGLHTHTHAPALTFLKTSEPLRLQIDAHVRARIGARTLTFYKISHFWANQKKVRVGNHTYYWCNL